MGFGETESGPEETCLCGYLISHTLRFYYILAYSDLCFQGSDQTHSIMNINGIRVTTKVSHHKG